ncbi:MAG: ferrous iron transport protein A [Desulfobacteraceae bacterium]|nr:ferrous iron transport protein A [Desulfobacteraceae bacterium]
MDKKTVSLIHLSHNKKARIIGLNGGQGFQRKLRVMGIREGQTIQIVSRQPFRGPLTVAVGGCQMTLGRGMAQRITVEEL